MCELCQTICDLIEQIYGHKIEMPKLVRLIETSPLSTRGLTNEEIKEIEKYNKQI